MEKDIYMNGAKASFQSAQNCLNQSDVLAFFFTLLIRVSVHPPTFLALNKQIQNKKNSIQITSVPRAGGKVQTE